MGAAAAAKQLRGLERIRLRECLYDARQPSKSSIGHQWGVYQTKFVEIQGDDTLPGAQIDMLIDRADQVIHLCKAKFTRDNFTVNK